MPFVHDGVRGIADFLIRVDRSGHRRRSPTSRSTPSSPASRPSRATCSSCASTPTPSRRRPASAPTACTCGWVRARSRRCRSASSRPTGTASAPSWPTSSPPTRPTPPPFPSRASTASSASSTTRATEQWRDEDSLVYVAGIRDTRARRCSSDGGVAHPRRARPSATSRSTESAPSGSTRLVDQATLQVLARLSPTSEPPPFRMIEPGRRSGVGSRPRAAAPHPTTATCSSTSRAHPFWRADTGLFFLFGLILREADGEWGYRAWWAHDLDEEATATARAHRLPGRRGGRATPACTSTTTTTPSDRPRAAGQPTTGSARWRSSQLIETGLFVDLLAGGAQRHAGRHRVLRPQVPRAADRLTSAATRSTRAPARSSSTSGT